MRILFPTVVLIAATVSLPEVNPQRQALFIRKDVAKNGKRVTRQTSADQMVQNILHWLQEVYNQSTRKIRQGSLREYLPPAYTQKPRPFEPPKPTISPEGENTIERGYPPAGSITPYPPFSENPPGYEIFPPLGPSSEATNAPSTTTVGVFTSARAGAEGEFTGYPSGGPSTGYPSGGPSTGYPSGGPSTGYPSGGPTTALVSEGPTPGPSEGPTPGPSEGPTTGYPSGSSQTSTALPSPSTPEIGTEAPGTPALSVSYPTPGPSTLGPSSLAPSLSTTAEVEGPSTAQPESQSSETPSSEENAILSESTEGPEQVRSSGGEVEEEEEGEDKHPPHIHNIDVECSKEMMTINIEFNKEFNGIIYSKGYYNNPDCRYVQENSDERNYSFTVSLNSCGTEFVNAFDTQGQAYLENVLVLQNEVGIQEVWDTVRAVRCLWEGNLKKALNVALSVGMLNQEIVTFSGDTAMARLDIQMGKGPFAPPANGLVKIGEIMTLVVSVMGDPGFDIQVKDCRAVDSSRDNVVPLTDEDGCVLKPKLFGAFQKTRDTGDTGASIMAYAYFNAFKFPDVMDLTLECNVDLCKTDCEMCPEPNQKTEPGRKKRDINYYTNRTEDDESVKIGKTLKVILPEDLGENNALINIKYNEGICLSTQGFIASALLLISLLCFSSLFSAYVWLKYQRLFHKK